MRNVALVPQRDVFERRLAVCANQPREPADLLASNWIALVRHGRRALLTLSERLLDLADFGFLKPTNLERAFLQRCRCNRERRQKLGVTIALNDLRRDRLGLQPEAVADIGFDCRRQMRERADG